jgi:hypothetical protein
MPAVINVPARKTAAGMRHKDLFVKFGDISRTILPTTLKTKGFIGVFGQIDPLAGTLNRATKIDFTQLEIVRPFLLK